MPIIFVEALEGRTLDQKRGLVKDMTAAVVKNFNVTPEQVTIVIREMKPEHLAKSGKLKSDS